MYQAFENIAPMVKQRGRLFISIYNDQGYASPIWRFIKKSYVSYPLLRPIIVALYGLWLWKYRIAWGTVRYGNPLKFIWEYGKNNCGMSAWHDVIDWVAIRLKWQSQKKFLVFSKREDFSWKNSRPMQAV